MKKFSYRSKVQYDEQLQPLSSKQQPMHREMKLPVGLKLLEAQSPTIVEANVDVIVCRLDHGSMALSFTTSACPPSHLHNDAGNMV